MFLCQSTFSYSKLLAPKQFYPYNITLLLQKLIFKVGMKNMVINMKKYYDWHIWNRYVEDTSFINTILLLL